MIFAWLIVRGWLKGDLVVGPRIGQAFLQKSSNVVIAFENQSAALSGEHLQA